MNADDVAASLALCKDGEWIDLDKLGIVLHADMRTTLHAMNLLCQKGKAQKWLVVSCPQCCHEVGRYKRLADIPDSSLCPQCGCKVRFMPERATIMYKPEGEQEWF